MSRHRLRFSPKQVVVFITILVLTAVILNRIFYSLYDVSRENIKGTLRNRTKEASQEFDNYLKMPIDAVSFSATTINAMMEAGTTTEAVGEYLIKETETYASVIQDNPTGVYGYYKGTYLDGSGWIPPDDYDGATRPWYIDAVNGDGKIMAVKPYMNMQTNEMMISVSKLLSDKESVVSMDIYIDGVQKIIEDISADNDVNEAYVVDSEGYIVAHTDFSRVGTHLNYDGDLFDKKVYRELERSEAKAMDLDFEETDSLIFVEDVLGVWKTVVVIDKRSTFLPLRSIFLFTGVVMFLSLGFLMALFMYVTKKHRETVELGLEVEAIADIYATVLKIDLYKDTITTMRFNKGDIEIFDNNFKSYKESAKKMAYQIASIQSRDLMDKFMAPQTLERRLEGLNSISQEFIDYTGRWVRARFIVVERDSKGALMQAILAFESIDEDKKRQEILRRMSETDSLTGIRNRGSGENMVRSLLAEGRSGMFCVMDVDDFKFVNDNFGHKAGDKVLITIAEILQRTFRDGDIVFRLGGDEFAVFSEGIVAQDVAEKAIGRFFQSVDEMKITELGGHKINISVGASFYPTSQADTFEELYTRADQASYESKKVSGSCVNFR